MTVPTPLLPPVAGETKREFLVRNSLAKAGARGRFGKEATAALAQFADFAFTDVVPAKPKAKPAAAADADSPETEAEKASTSTGERANPIVPQVRVRPQETLFALSPNGTTHVTIGYDTCHRADCGQPVSLCLCGSGPKPPAGAIPVPSGN